MNKLEQARQTIDRVDREMARLYEQRMDAVKDVLSYKKENNLPVFDGTREAQVLEKHKEYIHNDAYMPYYMEFLKDVMKNSKEYQKSLLAQDVVAYAGVEGAFSHIITERLFPNYPMIHVDSFDEVFQAVVDKKVQYGVIPFQNSNSGLVGEVLDLLLEYPVYIQEIADLKIEQCLLGVPGATLKDVEWVYSKDQALAQSREFLAGLKVQPVAYPNTAMAAQYVSSQKDVRKAAIGARENAALYDLEILATNIQANSQNQTRFIVIGLEPKTEGSRFSVCLTTKHESGSLAKIIQVIAEYGLNMESIQSRPIKGKPFEYFFFIEIDGDISNKTIQECLDKMKQNCEQVKILGTYSLKEDE